MVNLLYPRRLMTQTHHVCDGSIAFAIKQKSDTVQQAFMIVATTLWSRWKIFSFSVFISKVSYSWRRMGAPGISYAPAESNAKIFWTDLEIHSWPHKINFDMLLGYFQCSRINDIVIFRNEVAYNNLTPGTPLSLI